MGISNMFSQMRASKYDKFISMMELQEKCPDCNGQGFHFRDQFFILDNSDKCSSCNGSGLGINQGLTAEM